MPRLRRYGVCATLLACLFYMYYLWSATSKRFATEFEVFRLQQGGAAAAAGEKWKPHRQPETSGQRESIAWAKVPLKYPLQSTSALPTAKPLTLPRIQHQFAEQDENTKKTQAERRDEIKKQFRKCWDSYKEQAWMHDELQPVAGGFKDPFGGWAATLIDALDTLWIMGFEDEFREAIQHVEKIDFGTTTLDRINVFETNIRHLGGLLAAYELSGERRLLAKAKEVGEMLYHAFDTPNHMPITRFDMFGKAAGTDQAADSQILLAELGSFAMEFIRLSQATGDPKWYDIANRITQLLAQQQTKTRLPGMWPVRVDAKNMDLTEGTTFTLGSMADSTYEYFAKTHALLGGIDPVYERLYTSAMETAINHTLYRPMTPGKLDLLATGHIDIDGDGITSVIPELQHLACYAGGMFALGGQLFRHPTHVDIARKLTDTCIWAYNSTPSGIMPEVSRLSRCPSPSPFPSLPSSFSPASAPPCAWDPQGWTADIAAVAARQNLKPFSRLPPGFTEIKDRRYLLRPEAIESVFVLYRVTGDEKYRAAAWDMWTAVKAATETRLGHAAIWDVTLAVGPKASNDAAKSREKEAQGKEGIEKGKQDSMESFWMAETLKYFWLVFADPDVLSLDEWVLNTEAHPLRVARPL